MVFEGGSFSSTSGRIIICSLLHYRTIFECSIGGLAINTYGRAFGSGCLAFKGIKFPLERYAGLRRGNIYIYEIFNPKPERGFLSRNTNIACEGRWLSSSFCTHGAKEYCSPSVLSSNLESRSSKKIPRSRCCVYDWYNTLGEGSAGWLFNQERQSSRNLDVVSRWPSLSSRKRAINFPNLTCMQTRENGGLIEDSKRRRNLSRLSAQDFQSKVVTLVSQASKDLRSGNKIFHGSRKSSDKLATEAQINPKKRSTSTMHSDTQISSGTSHSLYHRRTMEVLLENGMTEPSGSVAVKEIEKASPVSNILEEMDDSLKKPSKKKKYTPEAQLRFELDMCSKNGDVKKAIDLYDKTIAEGHPKLNQYHYNNILYLCSSAALGVLEPKKSGTSNPRQTTKNHVAEAEQDEASAGAYNADHNGSLSEEGDVGGSMSGLIGKNVMGLSKEVMKLAEDKGFEIYQHMRREGVPRNEAIFTAVARLAVAREDGDLAFQMIKEMAASNVSPRLRSYGPALYTYYKKRDIEKAFEVDAHMLQSGILPEESELQVLLRLSVEAGQQERVYSLLHRLRATVRDLAPSTVDLIEQWFKSTAAENATIKRESMPTGEELRSAMLSKGGGWHGLGWLGRGKWKVEMTNINKNGFCQCCGEQLVTIDIDPQETEKFQESLATLACERAHCGSNFKHFQAWIDQHGPFDYVVDAANIGMYHQNFQGAGFNFFQLNAVVNELQRKHPSGKLPLIILHHKRANEARSKTPLAQRQLNEWSKSNAFYSTPTGSNDDWFWLYAAVKNKCLIVTNDEMRDHLFQLLGKDFFPKWKERHQVRFSFSSRGVNFHMPPPYSIVLQESISGSWHAPKSGGDDVVRPRDWLCVTRTLSMDMDENLSEHEQWSVAESYGKN